ncbi:MAG: acyl-CoA synthetase [Sphingomonadaceae bacterium]
MDLNQSVRRAAAIRPNITAIIDGDRQRCWAETADRIARIAASLSGLGVRPGDRIAILANNGAGYYETLFASFWIGAVAVPLNTRLAGPELEFQISDSGARILASEASFGHHMAGLRRSGVQTILDIGADGDLPDADRRLDDLLHADPVSAEYLSDDTLAGIFYTGGTTGLPKGVMHTHGSLHAMAVNLVMQLRLDSDTIILHSAPMFHLGDFATFVATLLGATHVFIPALDDVSMLDAIETHGVTHSFTVPAVIDRIARANDLATRDLSRLRVLGYGGAPMPWGTYINAREKLPAVDFIQGFGMTEMPAVTFLPEKYHRGEDHAQKLKSAGQPSYGYEIRIVDQEGRDVPRGTLGEIIGRGDNVMRGYWNREAETGEALRNGWMHSGDAGYMDEEGFVYITDRFKDMIVSGGENIYSIEVENVVSAHPAVLECAVIGVPDQKWGERVHAIVSLKDGTALDSETLIAFCRERIAGYKIPRSLEVHDGPLPRSAAGKVFKKALRAPHWPDSAQ